MVVEIKDIAPERQVSECEIQGINFRFKEFKAGVAEVDLREEEFNDLRTILKLNWREIPMSAAIIFVGERQRLAVVSGMDEAWLQIPGIEGTEYSNEPFIRLVRLDPEDKEIFVLHSDGEVGLFEDRKGKGMNLERCLPRDWEFTFRSAGTVTITAEDEMLMIQAKTGETSHK